jgi:hypothetical protein
MINIPISFNCGAAQLLKECNKRLISYPFDWNIKNFESIYLVLKDDTSINLFDNKDLIFGNKTFTQKYDNDPSLIVNLIPVYNKKYKILFVHDFNTQISNNDIIEKYNRRISRFLTDIKDENKSIFFTYEYFTYEYKKSIYNYWTEYFDDKLIFNDIIFDDNIFIDKINKIYPKIKFININNI